MRACFSCGEKNVQPRSPNCLKCQLRLTQAKYLEKNREKRKNYIKYYRKLHPEKALEWSRKAYCNKKGIQTFELRSKNKQGLGHVTKRGYKVLCRIGHPNAASVRGWIYEHTVVMSEHLGRPLHKGETVHHKNGDRLDNRIENLELWSKSHPPGQRVEDKITWAIDFLKLYGYTITK